MCYSFKRGITITNAFHKVLQESNHRLHKIWVDEPFVYRGVSAKK